jgi:hypothetical protein
MSITRLHNEIRFYLFIETSKNINSISGSVMNTLSFAKERHCIDTAGFGVKLILVSLMD